LKRLLWRDKIKIKWKLLVVVVVTLSILYATEELVLKSLSPQANQSEMNESGNTGTMDKNKQGRWRLIQMGSRHCFFCEKNKPVLKEIGKEYKGVLKVEFLGFLKHLKEAKKYGVLMIPTQVLLDPQGNVRWKHFGLISKDKLESALHEHGIAKPQD